MALASRVDGRRVFVLGIAGLVPAALLTLLFFHQPSVGERRLYPMTRGSLALVGLALALGALITWAMAPDRLGRSSLTGLAWAGVTAILCIGPFLESSPRVRLYAVNLETGHVEWASKRGGISPTPIAADLLVVTDVDDRELVGLDPATGDELWRHALDGDETSPQVSSAVAAGAFVPPVREEDVATTTTTPPPHQGINVVDGQVAALRDDLTEIWSSGFPSEDVLAAASTEDVVYAYIATPGVGGEPAGGSIAKLDVHDGSVTWRIQLPPEMAVKATAVALGAGPAGVVVAGGEHIGLVEPDHDLGWHHSVVTLGKSRVYALAGAVHQVALDDTYAYVSTTPDT